MHCRPGGAALQCLGQPEIEHLHRAVLCELDIGGLQIAMHDAVLVRRFERFGNLTGNRQRFVNRDRSLRDAVCQRRAVDELEHEGPLFEAVDLRDVRMVERRQHLRLALKARDAIGIGGKEIRKNLDGDVAAQPRITRSIHFAHAACADGGHNLVRSESSAGREGHCYWRRGADYSYKSGVRD